MAGMAGLGTARLGVLWLGPAGMAWRYEGRCGEARRGLAGMAGPGLAWLGLARLGRFGRVRRGGVCQGSAGQG